MSGLAELIPVYRNHSPAVAGVPRARALRAVACDRWYACTISEEVQTCRQRDPTDDERNELNARPTIAEARRAYLADRITEAARLAREAILRCPHSLPAHSILGVAGCRLRDRAMVRAAAGKLPKDALASVRTVCAEHGLEF